VRAGLAAGVLSGAPSGLGWLLGHGDPFAATREIGRRALGRPSLSAGAAAHLALSIALAAPAAALRVGRRPLLAGPLYGAALYVLDLRVLAPRVWPEVLEHDGPLQLADHLAYGVVVALVLSGSGNGRRSCPGASLSSSPAT
jgi:hypothetical protein